jgi:hypothetical protein
LVELSKVESPDRAFVNDAAANAIESTANTATNKSSLIFFNIFHLKLSGPGAE